MTDRQSIKLLITWAAASSSSAQPSTANLLSVLALLETAPACHETVFDVLKTFLTTSLAKLFQGAAPNKPPYTQRYAGPGKDRDRDKERERDKEKDRDKDKDRDTDASGGNMQSVVRLITAHMLAVLQKDSALWSPRITKWVISVLLMADPTNKSQAVRELSASTANVENIPVLETLLASHLKNPLLKSLSLLLSSSWLFLDFSTCNILLDELIASGGEGAGGKKAAEADWVLALVGVQDPDRTLIVSFRHLANLYKTLGDQQDTAQQLALHRAGKLVEFISFRFPVHASAVVQQFLDEKLFSTSQDAILQGLEEKMGFLACLGIASPKLFDAAFGIVLEKIEFFLDSTAISPTFTYSRTLNLLKYLLSERLQNIAASSYLPRIVSSLYTMSSNPTQGMETDSAISTQSLAQSLLSAVVGDICAIALNSTKPNEAVLWGVVAQWRMFWDYGEVGKAAVLASLTGLHLTGLHRAHPPATASNVNRVAGAVLAHAIHRTDNVADRGAYLSLVALLEVFGENPALLAQALDCVMELIGPNPHMSCVLLSRIDDILANPPAASIWFATFARNISLHWENILAFTTYPHAPLRLAALQLLRSVLPILYSQLTSNLPGPLPLSYGNTTPHLEQQHNLSGRQPIPSFSQATRLFHPNSILKIKMDTVTYQTIIRTLTKTFITNVQSSTLDFHVMESLMTTIAGVAALSIDHFGLAVTLLLDFIFSDASSNIIRSPMSTPLQPMNSLPRSARASEDDKEGKSLLEMNYTRYWRAQIHNRLGSGVFLPKRQRLMQDNTKASQLHSSVSMTHASHTSHTSHASHASPSFSIIAVRDNNIHNDQEPTQLLDCLSVDEPDLALYAGDSFALKRSAISALLGRCLATTALPPASYGASYFATLTDQLLVQLSTQAPVPTYEQYAEILPKISPFERDIFLRKIFKQNPILLDMLELIAIEPLEFIKLFEVVKGILANTIAHWNAEPGSSTVKNAQYSFTVRFISLLGKAQWIPHPLSCCGEIVNVLTPSELSMLLITMWNFVRDFPPSPESFAVTPGGKAKRLFAPPTRLSVFIRPMRTIVHAHIVELGALYRAFFDSRDANQ